ncbi:MAG: HAD family hydrolase, partial [Atopobiaceae bacterium]|nr:HAD family hydrolase [Atopobiaceae bacterium]
MERASAIVFDIDDTLYDLSWPYRKAFAEVFADRQDLPVSELFKVSRVHSDKALELLTAGKITPEDHKVLRVQWTLADYGVDVSRDEALRFQQAYARAQQLIQPYPEAIEMLQAVADAGVKMGALSNGDAAHQLGKVQLLGID